ncbi:MAG TPA: carboxypeptidase regulatory-like domain-containing protein [Anaerolineae bacterium]|nr:carboxypeptidase regulatory-like domain-containing protein [Anaerolineae bacterium]
MRSKKLLFISLFTLLLVTITPLNSSYAFLPNTVAVANDNNTTCTIDLTNNNSNNCSNLDALTFILSPENNETVFKLNLQPNQKAVFTVDFDDASSGWLVNIGDSATNNGYGGDDGTQSNDSELQIRNSMMSIYANQTVPPAETTDDLYHLLSVPNLINNGMTLQLEVSNEHLFWDNNNDITAELNSPYIYALNGQTDSEGSINYDIFASFNRSINSAWRTGSGVSQVTVDIVTYVPKVSFGGQVVDQNDAPLADANVTVNGQTTMTDATGNFMTTVDTSQQYKVHVEKMGYAPAFVLHDGSAADNFTFKLYQAEAFTISPGTAVDVVDSYGTTVAIPPNSLVDDDGNVATEDITLYMYTYDLANGEEMPGNMGGIDSNGQPVFLESAGAASFEFQGESGQLYNLADGSLADLSIPVNLDDGWGETIGLWSFDTETGMWIEESTATLVGDRYVGQVSHFSAWNFDISIDWSACIKFTVDPAYLQANPEFEITVALPNQSGYRTLLVRDPLNVLYNISANINLDVYSPASTTTPYAVVNSGDPWGGTFVPPTPYDLCNGRLHIDVPTEPTLQVIPAMNTYNLGDRFVVAIQSSDMSDLASIDGQINFDPTILQVIDADPNISGVQVAPGSCPDATNVFENNVDNTTGQINYSVIGFTTVCNGGNVALITFQAIDSGSSAITLDNWQALDLLANPINVNTQNDTVTILSSGAISGQVLLWGRTDHTGAIITAINNGDSWTTTTDNQGNFILALPPGQYTVQANLTNYLYAEQTNVTVTADETINLDSVLLPGGDVNDNGRVNMQDFQLLPPVDTVIIPTGGLGDTNGNGVIDFDDGVAVQFTMGNFTPPNEPIPWP